jgi:hypothetical protein
MRAVGKHVRTRAGANKGAAFVRMTVTKEGFHPTTVSFLNCHNNADKKGRNVADFEACVNLSKCKRRLRSHAKYQIMMGDFNPRLMGDPDDRENDPYKGKWLRSTKLKGPTKVWWKRRKQEKFDDQTQS